MSGPMLEAALQYAAIGWHVFPCHAGTKKPVIKGGDGFKSATTDEATIRAWWAEYPDANIGFYPYPSGMAAIDVDVKHGDGFIQLEVLQITHGDLPSTQKQITPSSGEHILFRTNSPMPNNKLSPDIDIRCANGYIMLAPSIADGRAYEWLDGWTAEDAVPDLDFAEMPQWVIGVQQAGIQEAAKPSSAEGSLTYTEPDEAAKSEIMGRLAEFLGRAPKAAKRFDGSTEGLLKDTSGSAMDFSMCALLKIGGFDYSETRFILEPWPHGSNSMQRGGDRYWERAWLRSSDPEKETAAMLDVEINEALGLDQPASEKQSSLKHIDLMDVMNAELEEVSFAVDKIFPKRHVTLFGGHGGMGKSMLALTMAAHVAAGAWFAGLPVEQSKVLFVSLEDEASVIKVRLRKIIQHFNLKTADVLNNLTLLDGTGSEAALMTQSQEFNGPPVMTKVFTELAHASENAGLIMIDNASDAYDGSENVRKEVRFFIRWLARMARARDASVVLLAHIDKAAQRNGTAGDDYSGSTAWHNSVRSRVALKIDPNHSSHSDEAAPLVLEHQKANLSSRAKTLRLEFIDGGLIVPIDDHGDGNGSDIDRETWDAVEMVRCIKLAIEQYGLTIPTRHTAGMGSVMREISHIKEYPSAFKGGKAGNSRASAAILLAKSNKWIIEESYTDHNKNKKTKFVVSSTYENPIDLPI